MESLIYKDLIEEASLMKSPLDIQKLNQKFPFLEAGEIEKVLKENGHKNLKVERRG